MENNETVTEDEIQISYDFLKESAEYFCKLEKKIEFSRSPRGNVNWRIGIGEKRMKYLAHREKEREQLLLDHLTGTAEKAKKFAEVFGKGDWGYCCGMLHDLGKYSDKFQRRQFGVKK